ncbi:MAG: winged helix-turn-helix domain-containing protein [Thermoanaerobaculales bacterium]|jgi:DNA-binding winged helix-turn-helix (wHTH) protein/tetratricopeptide (TPR) repeat protein|nr:winged helix-turn-helix domain-containing protein [Thermoanaerobaculales bacterium]
MGDLQGARWRVGDVVFDPADGALRRDGRRIALTPKVIGILGVLVEAAPRTVTKEQILDAVWPETVVSEAALTQRVRELRHALGDDARTPRYLATVSRRGYRLIAPVERIGQPPEAPTVSSVERVEPALANPTAARRSARGRGVWTTAALLAVVVAALGWLAFGDAARRRAVPSAPPAPVPSPFTPRPGIAVLEPVDEAGGGGAGWVGTALAEMLVRELGAGGALRTIGAAAVADGVRELHLGPRPWSSGELGRLRALLGADLLVAGSYRLDPEPSGPALVVDLEVLETRSGVVRGGVHERGELAELAALTGRVGGQLRRTAGVRELSPADEEGLRRSHPREIGSTRLFAEGVSHMRLFDFPAAIAAFEAALVIEPDSATFLAALAQAQEWGGHKELARETIAAALGRAEGMPREQQLVIEADACAMAGEWQRAAEIGRSLHVLRPDEIEYGLSLASLLAAHGLADEAERILEELRRLPEPLGLDPRIDLAEAWMHESDLTGKLAAASRSAERSRELGARLLLASARIQQGRAYRGLGKPDEALAAFEEAWRLREAAGDTSGVGRALRHVAAVERDRGQLAAAADHLRVAVEIADRLGEVDQQVGVRRDLAAVALDRGSTDEAARHLLAARDAAGGRLIPEESAWLAVESARRALLVGPTDAAVAAAREAVDVCVAEGLGVAEARARAVLARALVAVGELDAAAAEAQAADRLSATTDDRAIRLEASVAATRLAAAGSGCGAAAPALAKALAEAANSTASLRLEARSLLGLCARQGGDEATALAILAGVSDEAAELGIAVPDPSRNGVRPIAGRSG